MIFLNISFTRVTVSRVGISQRLPKSSPIGSPRRTDPFDYRKLDSIAQRESRPERNLETRIVHLPIGPLESGRWRRKGFQPLAALTPEGRARSLPQRFTSVTESHKNAQFLRLTLPSDETPWFPSFGKSLDRCDRGAIKLWAGYLSHESESFLNIRRGRARPYA